MIVYFVRMYVLGGFSDWEVEGRVPRESKFIIIVVEKFLC